MNHKQTMNGVPFARMNADRKNVLIIEDDPLTSDILFATMKEAGLEVVAVSTTIEMAWREIRKACPDLIVLDLGLPDGNGMTFAREIRLVCASVGILVVTARTETIDVVLGLELGADDYVRKPFIPREVSARAYAILRRMHNPALSQQPSHVIRFGGWCLDTQERRLLDENNNETALTRAEFDLLKHLLESAGRVQSREQLLSVISHQAEEITDRTVDVIIGRLRRKILDDSVQPKIILTVRGIGYRLVLQKVHA